MQSTQQCTQTPDPGWYLFKIFSQLYFCAFTVWGELCDPLCVSYLPPRLASLSPTSLYPSIPPPFPLSSPLSLSLSLWLSLSLPSHSPSVSLCGKLALSSLGRWCGEGWRKRRRVDLSVAVSSWEDWRLREGGGSSLAPWLVLRQTPSLIRRAVVLHLKVTFTLPSPRANAKRWQPLAT